jgi:hypothetical protein
VPHPLKFILSPVDILHYGRVEIIFSYTSMNQVWIDIYDIVTLYVFVRFLWKL